MAYHGAIFDRETGKPRRLYIVRDATRAGYHWGVSERANLIALRSVPIGSKVWISFVERQKTGKKMPDGRDQEMMIFDVRAETMLPRPIQVALPSRDGDAGGARSYDNAPPVGGDDDIPF